MSALDDVMEVVKSVGKPAVTVDSELKAQEVVYLSELEGRRVKLFPRNLSELSSS